MAIVIEDGSGVPNANSYGVTDADSTVAAAKAFAIDRGAPLPDDAEAIKAFLIKATDYLESKSAQYRGYKTSDTQPLSWPRQCVQSGNAFVYLANNVIPQLLLNALYQLCIEQNNGVDLMPTVDYSKKGGFVVREKLDVLETQYSERIGTTSSPVMPLVDSWLAPLLNGSSGFALSAVRV